MPQLPDVQTIDSYGGLKADAFDVVDPETTESADEHNRLAVDTAAMTRMALRATVRFVGTATGDPTDPGLGLVHYALWGSALEYKPVVTETINGYLVTWPVSVVNELGETVLLNIRWARAIYESGPATAAYIVSAQVASANSVSVFVKDAAGTPDRADGTVIAVDIY